MATRRRYRRNPPTNTLLLIGGAAAVGYLFFFHRMAPLAPRPGSIQLPRGVTVNPDGTKTITLATGQRVTVPASTSNDDIKQAIQAAALAQSGWGIVKDVASFFGGSSVTSVSPSSSRIADEVATINNPPSDEYVPSGGYDPSVWSNDPSYMPTDGFDPSVWDSYLSSGYDLAPVDEYAIF